MTKEENQKRIGARLAEIRNGIEWTDEAGIHRKGLTQVELSERCGVSQSHITRIEAGKYDVKLSTVETIAEAMGKKVYIV